MQGVKYKVSIVYRPAKGQEFITNETFNTLQEAEKYANIKRYYKCEIKVSKIIESEEVIKEWINN